MKTFLLDGEWVGGPAVERVVNPWNGEVLAELALADAGQVEKAVASCHAAFLQSRKAPAWQRSQVLAKASETISRRRDEFARTIVAEAGKPISLAEAEVERARVTFQLAAQLALGDEGQLIRMDASPQGVGHFGLVGRFPVGVILGITPFNFPLNLVAHKVAPSIASGNALLLKPALKTPLSALLLAEVLQDSGLPAGLLNVVPFGHEHIPALLKDERIKMLSFTGSVGVGWKLKGEAVKMKVALELGGNAAVVVEPDADWKNAIAKIASGAFGYAGQSCISVQRILVHEAIYGEFRDAFVDHVRKAILVGDPAERSTVLGPMINGPARDKVVKWVQEAEAAGAKLLLPLRSEGENLLHPMVIEGAPKNAAVVCEEAFAPLVVLDSYSEYSEAIDKVNDSAFGLQAGVFTSDVSKAMRAFHELNVGGVMINQVPTFRVENMPYGGVKDSGFGREGVRYAMEEMTEPRSLVMNLG